MKLLSSIAAASIIGASMFVCPPAVEAKEHHHHHGHHHKLHELRRSRREFRHDVRAFNHYERAYDRDWGHARSVYNREVYGYPPVIPVYGYNHYRNPGFGIQLRF